MSYDKDGGPAFPCPDAGDEHFSQRSAYMGMTLRDHFAGQAMQILWEAYHEGYCGLNNSDDPSFTLIAAGAYKLADAMLLARSGAAT